MKKCVICGSFMLQHDTETIQAYEKRLTCGDDCRNKLRKRNLIGNTNNRKRSSDDSMMNEFLRRPA